MPFKTEAESADARRLPLGSLCWASINRRMLVFLFGQWLGKLHRVEVYFAQVSTFRRSVAFRDGNWGEIWGMGVSNLLKKDRSELEREGKEFIGQNNQEGEQRIASHTAGEKGWRSPSASQGKGEGEGDVDVVLYKRMVARRATQMFFLAGSLFRFLRLSRAPFGCALLVLPEPFMAGQPPPSPRSLPPPLLGSQGIFRSARVGEGARGEEALSSDTLLYTSMERTKPPSLPVALPPVPPVTVSPRSQPHAKQPMRSRMTGPISRTCVNSRLDDKIRSTLTAGEAGHGRMRGVNRIAEGFDWGEGKFSVCVMMIDRFLNGFRVETVSFPRLLEALEEMHRWVVRMDASGDSNLVLYETSRQL
ncbi:hypothetical protein BDK51DRAFT_44440 [Blyttiomyces helicus]|uniref:Uncharacterized protein n=1 Tax=Blyttiomyces helicus TaxID=388810 RepID=A0A4P9WGM6_9FUNG|nr:hypothetical protein BDK51DRAFT_44440 [Blyttiomyces helicus]|eukprot:RKO91065.1 hypothetical protein BDK51DRAFT_44440 [Blyttiomyces helicus]